MFVLNKITINFDQFHCNTTKVMNMNINIALRRFLHNHGNIATEGSPKPGLCPTLISNDFEGSF